MYPQSLHLYRVRFAAVFLVPAFAALCFTIFFGWDFSEVFIGVFFLTAATAFFAAGLAAAAGFFFATGDALAFAATGFFIVFALLFLVTVTAFAMRFHHRGTTTRHLQCEVQSALGDDGDLWVLYIVDDAIFEHQVYERNSSLIQSVSCRISPRYFNRVHSNTDKKEKPAIRRYAEYPSLS
jgi:hypothetical protein